MHNDTLQQDIIRIEQMIHDLKQAKNAGTMISSFSYTDTSTQAGYTGLHKITYEQGTMPIITECYASVSVTMFTPEDNTQYYSVLSQGPGTVYLFSTRKIVRVEYLGT